MKTWEYIVRNVESDQVELILNRYAKEGWELVQYGIKSNPIWSFLILRRLVDSQDQNIDSSASTKKKSGWPKGKTRG